MWVANSTGEILEDIEHINKKKNALSVDTFDFSTLYTKINLEDLKERIKEGGFNFFVIRDLSIFRVVIRDLSPFHAVIRENLR